MSTDRAVPSARFQFTLRQLLIFTALASIACAAYYWLGENVAIVAVAFVGLLAVGAVLALAFYGNFYEAGGLALLVLFVSMIFLPLIGSRELSQRGYCQNNLHNIVIALQSYHDTCGSYPPPFIADASGRPMHSWRVLLLPFLEQKELYDKYRFDEPWDGPNNRKLHGVVVNIFQCPSNGKRQPNTDTNYAVVVGSTTVWVADAKYPVRDADIIDGLSATILLVEVADSGIHWMEPRDLQFDQMPMVIDPSRGKGISSHHPGGAMIGFADGRIQFVENSIASETLRAALTRNGKDKDRLAPLVDPR